MPQNEQNYRQKRNKDCTWQEVDGKNMTAMFAKMHGFFQNSIVFFKNNSVGFRQGSLNYFFWGDQAMQIHGNFEGIPL